ncbi:MULTISPECIES: biopolymer transporter ExbD [Halobacteriovorax]|uniref:Biopolymer transporter ExbD n=1 Tax=Halobacteriovorax vibrionivorans TaxID=2152716 RepID=A0ABY0IL02_9BACT|nr:MULTISPECIES: biopolymer transporter ExbD [Halobacteriovorax]AYF45468.1 transport energizing protein, ExbD/TolR family [Halobacteriovorax sp. BALOs_7]RZF22546.1 biopolymer transporter ExbD [Halobacteriovorax vibrionivorans]TGD47738.1 biopolymer transporter ExbD [Halobacteriovorax sp. Y22]
MGMNTGGNGDGPMSEINVTPLVDVMLVLLVIFMITAPLMLNGIELTLPKTKEVNVMNLSSSQVVLSFTNSEEFYVGKDKILMAELIKVLNLKLQETKSQTLFLRADYQLEYGKVAKLMSYLKSNNINNIALVTELEE